MFNKDLEKLLEEISNLKEKNRELSLEKRLELEEKDFQLKHFKDEEVSKLKEKIEEIEKENAVFKKEIEMLDKVIKLDKDIVDVKQLIKDLIGKLPEIKLNNLTIRNDKE